MNESQENLEVLPSDNNVRPWWGGVWETNQKWRDILAKKLAYRSVDIKDEEMIGSNNMIDMLKSP